MKPDNTKDHLITLIKEGKNIIAIKEVRDKEGISLYEAKRYIEHLIEEIFKKEDDEKKS